jgi:hypothetical protein
MCKSYFILAGALLVYSGLLAQDKVYYKKDRIDNWKVTEVNPHYLKAVDAADPGLAYSTTPANVLFLFNKTGNFLVIPGMYDANKNAELNVKNFLSEDRTIFHELDKIITTKNEIIICHYQSVDEKNVVYRANKTDFSIPKSEVALIVFKNGEHRLLTSVEKVYKVLNVIQDKYTELSLAEYEEKGETGDSSLAKTDVKQDSKFKNPAHNDTITGDGQADQKLPPSTVLKLQSKALANIKQLGDYIQMICQKDSDPDEVTKAIEQALTLFIGDAKIEVSSINRSTVNQFSIKDYLIKLGYLKYEKVIIEWYNIQYTSLLRKGPDGNYYGTIEFEQRFVGFSSDNRKYQDITRKTVEVVLKSYERNTGGETTMEWDVFLGDIGVTVTKPA